MSWNLTFAFAFNGCSYWCNHKSHHVVTRRMNALFSCQSLGPPRHILVRVVENGRHTFGFRDRCVAFVRRSIFGPWKESFEYDIIRSNSNTLDWVETLALCSLLNGEVSPGKEVWARETWLIIDIQVRSYPLTRLVPGWGSWYLWILTRKKG